MRPKNALSEPSSDLERARASAARLVASRGAQAASPTGEPPAWARLGARPWDREIAAAPALVEVAEPSFDLAAIESAGERAWNAYLEWAIASAPAEGAFFVDDHGLVIATRGALPSDDLESSATRFVLALDQAARIDPTAPAASAVVVDVGERWWTGLRVASSIVLVLVGATPIPRARAARIAQALARAVDGLSR